MSKSSPTPRRFGPGKKPPPKKTWRDYTPQIALGAGGVVVLLVVVWAAFFAGRVKINTREKEDPGEAEMQKMLSLYQDYLGENKAKSPASIDQIKGWLRKKSADQLKQMQVDDIEKACTSPRDNQPYVVVPKPDTSAATAVVLYEKTGVNGKRFVGTSVGRVFEPEPDQFRDLVPNAR